VASADSARLDDLRASLTIFSAIVSI